MQQLIKILAIMILFSVKAQAQSPAETSFTTTILVNQTPKEAFDAINNVRGWWSKEIVGNTASPDSEFYYHYEDVHKCTLKIVEWVPGKRVVWLVRSNYFNFTKDKTEWTGTRIIFDISQVKNKTQIRFTHQGLIPGYECYKICTNAWGKYINESLFDLITTGKGKPNEFNRRVKTK